MRPTVDAPKPAISPIKVRSLLPGGLIAGFTFFKTKKLTFNNIRLPMVEALIQIAEARGYPSGGIAAAHPGHDGVHEFRADRFAARLLISPVEYAAAETIYGPHPAPWPTNSVLRPKSSQAGKLYMKESQYFPC